MSYDHDHAAHHRGPIPGEIPVPHGNFDEDTVTSLQLIENEHYQGPGNDKDEKAIFDHVLRPDDSYDANGTYWADLPLMKRLRFVSRVENDEAKKEFKSFLSMLKKDPLSPVSWYFRNAVLPGAGMGLEGYVLFSIGNVSSLYEKVWPECWKKFDVCNKQWVAAVTYLEIVGIIVGQILVGLIGDAIGRRFGLIQDAAIMFLGLVMLTASWGTTLNGWVICYAWCLFFYSVGVGGEYPMTATSGMERGTNSRRIHSREDRLHRGRKVVLAFMMQGWGQFFNQVFLILLLLIFHHGSGNPPYSKVSAQWTYRVAFAIPAVGTLWLLYYRTYKMPNASKVLQQSKQKAKVTGYDVESLKLCMTHFFPRIVATCFGWFAADVFFYGSKLFQSQFIKVISPNNDTIILGWLYNLINIGVSMAGYYLAGLLIDNKLYGRKNMQQMGFLLMFILFVVPAFHFKYYTSPGHIREFQTMYFLSSFFTQFGPNCVTFLVAAEVYPTPIRATAHGLSAACGKMGALLASVLYNYIDIQTKFYFVPWFGLAGMLTTFLFLPDVTGLDLTEQDRRWEYIRAGRGHEYHGIAVHPQHLSVWERFRGVGKQYDPELDYKQKVEEMRREWLEKQKLKATEMDSEKTADFEDEEQYSPEMHSYFHRTSPMIVPNTPVDPRGENGTSEKLPDMVLPASAKN